MALRGQSERDMRKTLRLLIRELENQLRRRRAIDALDVSVENEVRPGPANGAFITAEATGRMTINLRVTTARRRRAARNGARRNP